MMRWFLVLFLVLVTLTACGTAGTTTGSAASQKTKLLRQIDEYEQWTQRLDVQLSMGSRTNPIEYTLKRDHFAAQRHPFQEYLYWWQDDYQQQNPSTGYTSFIADLAAPELLRDGATIDRFLVWLDR